MELRATCTIDAELTHSRGRVGAHPEKL